MIYFIVCEPSGAGPEYIKIGYARRGLEKRLTALQVGSPHPLRVLSVIEGSQDIETAIHAKWQGRHYRGEWYAVSQELLEWIEEEAQQFADSVATSGVFFTARRR
jgi:hypothetical protein